MIADDFQAVSGVGFDNCSGAIDGILIWMEKPSQIDAQESGLSRKKLLCARKNKFGLNMQALSDCRGRILDLSINYGGASGDIIAFEASDLMTNWKKVCCARVDSHSLGTMRMSTSAIWLHHSQMSLVEGRIFTIFITLNFVFEWSVALGSLFINGIFSEHQYQTRLQ